jgi:DNA (cytosine-5)-methyltransferase 1
MVASFAVVDLFAGPGGLAEGFSAVRTSDGARPFRLALSLEMDAAAHSTLQLRSFLRQFPSGPPPEYYAFLNDETREPVWSTLYPDEWRAACREALKLTIGGPGSTDVIDARIAAIRREHGGATILIGGPPCQAYSLVGRARNQGKAGYVAEDDHRHRLYEEYVSILGKLRPAAFVMENVKGLLSSSLDGSRIFERVLGDLRSAGGENAYKLVALAPPDQAASLGLHREPSPSDFVICAENHGLPQARHRVIVTGIRRDLYDHLGERGIATLALARGGGQATVGDVLDGMPKLRSGLSRTADHACAWTEAVQEAVLSLSDATGRMDVSTARQFRERLSAVQAAAPAASTLPRGASKPAGIASSCPPELRDWIVDPALEALPNHETRSHMASDLARYLFTAIHGEVTGASPKSRDFPLSLAPDHRSWTTGKFADRFRVQLRTCPSTTVTSHIAKDGHYFIHYDAEQCRSLTVREAARLQTFPDNYYFKGNRTEQFSQVGNAVPPFLAKQIGEALHNALTIAIENARSTEQAAPPSRRYLRWSERQPARQLRAAARRALRRW